MDESLVFMDGADPWVIFHDGFYYYCTSDQYETSKKILVYKFSSMDDILTVPGVEVWPNGNTDIPQYDEAWAPELQIIDGIPYIYVTLYKGNKIIEGIGPQERIHCLEGNIQDLQSPFIYKKQISSTTDRWSIDGSILEVENKRYFVWSGWDGHENHSQNLYIAEMSNPWTLSTDRVLISSPELDWEKNGFPYVNEGPQALYHDDQIFIIYSASASWTDDYCLGQLTYVGNDPLHPASWQKEPEPVFKKSDTVFGVGHASFIKDRQGSDWMVYHSAKETGSGWVRHVRAKRFGWKENGYPDFGVPR
jgi:GH43 family beta-xylosidase